MYTPIGAAKIVLFLHIRKKKVQFVVKPALFLGESKESRISATLKSKILNLQ